MDNFNMDSKKHKRRVRYKGSHPRRFQDKYKELNFEQYPEDVAKVIESGKTPAGTHRPICVTEILEILKPSSGETGLDATLGFGGHAVKLLERLKPDGRLFAMDVDPLEIIRTERRLRALGFSEKELVIKRSNFAGAFKLLDEAGGGFDFVLADLGISSMQLDNPERGFTFKWEGPLDLRLNPERGLSAAQLIQSLNIDELERLLFEYSDEPYARVIAEAIFEQRLRIQKTTDLADVITKALGKKLPLENSTAVTNSIRRVFQAVRIAVNDEFSVLEQFLRHLPFCLKPGGRAAILSFHSGEDKRVTRFFQQGLTDGIYAAISPEAVRPSPEEQYSNPRSTSALLRWAVKI